LNTRLPTASDPLSLNALPKILSSATLCSRRAELGVVGSAQTLLDEPKVRPEDMGHNGIGMRDVDHCGEQLWHSESRAGAMRGQPQGAETGVL